MKNEQMIKTIMSIEGVTYQELGEAVGVTKQTISNWISGRVKMPKAYLFLIMIYLIDGNVVDVDDCRKHLKLKLNSYFGKED